MLHSRMELHQFLSKTLIAVLSYLTDEGFIESSILRYAHSNDGDFYLLGKRGVDENTIGSEKYSGSVLSIYKEEVTLDEINKAVIYGKIEAITDFDSEEAKEAFSSLGNKSPFLRSLPVKSDRDTYFLLKFTANKIVFHTFGEEKRNEEPTVLKRV